MRKLNWYLITLIVISFIAGLSYSLYRSSYKGTDRQTTQLTAFRLSDFELPDLINADASVTLDSIINEVIDGKPVLFNVWGSWCVSCRIEHPYLLELANQGITIVGVNYLDNREKAEQWLNELGNPYRINLFDNQGRLGADLGVIGAPETYVINAAGQVVARHRGIIDQEVFTTKLKPLL